MKLRGDKGQALLFVVISMTIALAVGVSVSLRTLSSVSRVATTDTSSRVLSAAEGGLERFLLYSSHQLNEFSTANSDLGTGTKRCVTSETCRVTDEGCMLNSDDCIIEFPPTTTEDTITAKAYIKVFPYGDEEYLDATLEQDKVREIDLEGYSGSSVRICFQSPNTAVYFTAYGVGSSETDVRVVKGLLCKNGHCFPGPHGDYEGVITPSNSGSGFCTGLSSYTLDLTPLGSVKGLRIRYHSRDGDPITVRIASTSGNPLPIQGYEIISIGELSEAGNVQATKTIKVKVSKPYLPAIFDFGIFANN